MKAEGLYQFAAARHVYCTEPVEFIPRHSLFFNVHSSVIMSSLKSFLTKILNAFQTFPFALHFLSISPSVNSTPWSLAESNFKVGLRHRQYQVLLLDTILN